MENPYFLVKVVDKQWAEKFMDGEVFMRAISCFGDLSRRSKDSQNQFRGDVLEGFSYSFKNHHNPFAHIEDTSGNISEIAPNQVGLIDVLKYREKIFCLYALEYDIQKSQFIVPDERISEFGDTAVIVYRPQAFLYRVCQEMLGRFGNDFWTSFMRVDYDVDFSTERPYDEFSKAPSYSWQKEFRIALDLAQGKFDPDTISNITDFARLTFPGKIEEDTNPDSLADSITLNIGDTRDISISVPVFTLFDGKAIESHIPKDALPPYSITPLIVPRPPKPTFFKLVSQLP